MIRKRNAPAAPLSRRFLRAVTTALAVLLGAKLGMAGDGKPQIILLHPNAQPPDTEAIVVPAASPMRLLSFPRNAQSDAVFRGRFVLSGIYEIAGSGEASAATIWPDRKSRSLLPYWREHGGPDEIDISNVKAFSDAVLSPQTVQKLKANKLESVRGRITIIADDYRTSIECDVASFSARFVSVVTPSMKVAANPAAPEGC